MYGLFIKNRISGSTEDEEMFGLIKSGIRFDQSKLFSDHLSNVSELLPKAVKNLTSFTKEYNVVQRSLLTKKLDTVNQDLSAVIGK